MAAEARPRRLHEDSLAEPAEKLQGQQAEVMRERAARVRDLRELGGFVNGDELNPRAGITNEQLRRRFSSNPNSLEAGKMLYDEMLHRMPTASAREDATDARNHFVHRWNNFRLRLLPMAWDHFRFQTQRESWRRCKGPVGLPRASREETDKEMDEMREWRRLLAEAARGALHEHDRPVGHHERADTGGATEDQLRLLRICAETGPRQALDGGDIRAMAQVNGWGPPQGYP